MRITLEVQDGVWDAYADHAEALQAASPKHPVTAEELMASHLERFRHIQPHDRIVVIGPNPRARLEELLAGGSLRDAEDLVQKVERIASLHIGAIVVDFTPPQWEEMARRAERNGKTVQQLAEATVADMAPMFFDHVPT